MIKMKRNYFVETAWAVDFDDIREDYTGEGSDTAAIGLVGSLENLLRFFAAIGHDSQMPDSEFSMDDVDRLAYSMGQNSMGRSNAIYYWSERILALTDED